MKKIASFCLLFVYAGLLSAQTEDMGMAELKKSYLDLRDDALSNGTKKISSENQTKLDGLVDQMAEKCATCYEYYLIYYINGNYDTERGDELLKAYELAPADKDVLIEMLGYYILNEDASKQKELLGKIQKYYTPAELAYYSDAMPSESSILFASTKEDMYGFLLARQTEGVGANVQVINLDFMKNDSYRKMVSSNSGVTDQTFIGNEKAYLKNVLTKSSKKIFISATIHADYLSLVAEQTYLTGLFYQYGNIDQLKSLQVFWNKVKSKDLSHLSISSSSEKKLYANYLPPLLTLYMFQPSDAVLKSAIQGLAQKTGRTVEVNEIISEIEAGE